MTVLSGVDTSAETQKGVGVMYLSDRGRGRRRWVRWVSMFVAIVLSCLAGPAAWAAAPTAPPAIVARAALLIDATTGQVLASEHAHRRLPMASVTKLMTLVLAFRAVDQGRVRLSDWVPVSDEAYRTGGSQIWLEPRERLSLRQMLTAIAVGSANDASVAVAQFLAGSTGAFVAEMNAEAARLGMTDTHFDNPHGLPSVTHYSSAADLARLAQRAVKMPGLLALTSQWQDRTIRNGKGGTLWLINQNRLLRTFAGTDGLKTGYTAAAGFCLVATTVRGGTRLIMVVLGAPSSAARFQDATKWLSWGFAHFRTAQVVRAGQVMGTVRVRRGRFKRVDAVARQSVFDTLPKSEPVPAVAVQLPQEVAAPVARGQVLGQATVKRAQGDRMGVSLVAARPVAAVGVAELFWQFFRTIIGASAGVAR